MGTTRATARDEEERKMPTGNDRRVQEHRTSMSTAYPLNMGGSLGVRGAAEPPKQAAPPPRPGTDNRSPGRQQRTA